MVVGFLKQSGVCSSCTDAVATLLLSQSGHNRHDIGCLACCAYTTQHAQHAYTPRQTAVNNASFCRRVDAIPHDWRKEVNKHLCIDTLAT